MLHVVFCKVVQYPTGVVLFGVVLCGKCCFLEYCVKGVFVVMCCVVEFFAVEHYVI